MTNKEKLEVIDKVLDGCYETINLNIHNNKLIPKQLTTNFKDISQTIYNLESTRLLLEPIQIKNLIYPIDGIPDPDENYFKRKNFIV